MHGSILPVTMPPPGIPPGICNFFLTWRSIPHPGHAERDNSQPPGLLTDHKYVVLCTKLIDYDIDFRTIAKPEILTIT